MSTVSLRSVLLEFPERESGELRLSVSVEYGEGKAPTPDDARKAAVRALRHGLEQLEAKEGSDLGHRDDFKRFRHTRTWSVS